MEQEDDKAMSSPAGRHKDGFIYTAAGGAYKQFAPVPDEAGCAASGGMGRRQDRTGFGQLLDSHADRLCCTNT